MKVGFLIVGTQKGGTTALAKFLSEHPKICMPNEKELHYFDTNEYFNNINRDYSDYHKHFSPMDSCDLYGEATPSYMYWKSAPKRIKAYNSNMKIIYILRNPVERAYSHYIMEKNRNNELWSFSMAIRFERLRCLRSFPNQERIYSYVDRGFYVRQIKNMLKYFPREQILFLKTEDLKTMHTQTINKVCDFLEVARLEHNQPEVIFSNSYLPIQKSDKRYLLKKYKGEIGRLEKLLDWDCSSWNKL